MGSERGCVVQWSEMLGYGVEGCGFKSQLGSTCNWKTLSVHPAVNGYLFLIREE